MKKSFKRILAIVLTVVMVMTAIPLSGIVDFDWGSLFATKASAVDMSELAYFTRLKAKTSKDVVEYVYYDFDNDSKYEMFVLVGTDDSYLASGDLYYINSSKVEKIISSSNFVSVDDNYINIYNLCKTSFISVTTQPGNYYRYMVYVVESSDYKKTNISDYSFDEIYKYDNYTLGVTQSTLDALTDGTGRTWKEYYFYWDINSKEFIEYGGISITKSQLSKVLGANDVLNKLDKMNASIQSIYYRENGIININFVYTSEYGSKCNENVNLKYNPETENVELLVNSPWNDSDILKSSFGGIYYASVSNNSTYPSTFLEVKDWFINKTSYKIGDIIEFGYYPQSKVTDSKTIAELDKISKNWISYGYYSGTGNFCDGNMKPSDYMMYADIDNNNDGKNDYRAVKFTKYRPTFTDDVASTDSYGHQYAKGYTLNKVYYFAYEPIKWQILDPDSGLAICNSIIDSQPFNETVYKNSSSYYKDKTCKSYANDYNNSSLREWLNNSFYNSAFDSTHKDFLSYNNDNVFLLSSDYIQECIYDEIYPSNSYSEYAEIQNLDTRYMSSNQMHYLGYPFYYTKTSYDYYGSSITAIDSQYQNVSVSTNSNYIGVVPAIMLKDIDTAVEAQNKKTKIFSENKYIADIWLNRRGGETTSESKLVSEILSYPSISSEIYNDLLKNDDFTDSLKGWTTLKSLFDSVDLAKDVFTEKDIYETLILDLLKRASKDSSEDSNKIIYDALDTTGDVADNVSKYKKIIFSMSSMVKGSDKVVLDFFKNWKINPKNTETYKKFFNIISEYESESDSLKKWGDNGFVEGIGALAEVSSDVSDFYKRVAAYMYITDMSDEMVALLKEMYKNTSSEPLKSAITDVLIGFQNENYINLLLTNKLSKDIALSVTDALYDDVSEAIPGYNLLKTSYGVAVTFDDLMFNTSNTLDKFYLIQATYNFIDANKKAINNFKNNYLSSNSETDAAAYVYAVKTYNHAYEIDLESAVSFTKAASNDGLINYAKRSVKCLVNLITGNNLKTSYQSLSESKDNIVKNLDFLFYSLDNSWKFNEEYLQKDFPDVYPVYLSEELSKDVYKPSITSCYIEKSGKTDLKWSVPYNFKASDGQYYPLYGSLWINGIESSETVGTSKTNSNYNSISNAPNPIQFFNSSKLSTFPKTYEIKAYSNTSSGKVYTPTETMKMEKPVKNVSISLSMSEFLRRSGDGVSITITDNSESVYDYIKYNIYRKTNNSSWTLLKTIDRDFDLRGYNTVFVDDTISEGNQYTYKVVSSITFDNGVTIKSGDSNEISVNGTKTSPMVNNLRTKRISKSTPVLKTRMLMAAPARNAQSGIEISWDAIDNAKQYEIYRMVSYGTIYNLIATVDGDTLSYIDEEVRDAVGYDYLVVPCTVSGENKTYETNACAQGNMTYASGNVKSVSVDDIEIKYKTSATITPNIITNGYINYTATYESSNPSVATVDKDGNITTLHKGDTTITCTITDEYGNVVKDTCNVNVYFSFGQWLIWILLFGFLWY